jgi:hypothetical protein
VEWDLKIISNLIQAINDYGIEKKIWFDIIDILHVIISKSKHCWWIDNNYTQKLVTEMLSQITYDFHNIHGDHDRLLDIVLDFQI